MHIPQIIISLIIMVFSVMGSSFGKIQKTALIIENYEHAPIGNLEQVLIENGFSLSVLKLPLDQKILNTLDPQEYDLLVVLGGLMGAYETEKYPFLQKEIEILKIRNEKKLPSFGICLGAQLMARALGATVYQGPQKELGWFRLQPTAEGLASPLVPLFLEDSRIFESHFDHYEQPKGATILAKTDQYQYQSFMVNNHLLATQFHPEATLQLIAHVIEMIPSSSESHQESDKIKEETTRYWSYMQPRIRQFYESWLQQTGLISVKN